MTTEQQPAPQSQPARPSDMVLRLQIGAGGLLAVLLLVGLAGIIGKQAADQAVNDAGGAPVVTDPNQAASDQPLIDLGVQPANRDSAGAAPVAAPIEPGTTVPDLPADPARKTGQ